MPNPDLNWNGSANNHFSSNNADTQFRECFYAMKETIKSAGWSVVESSKGDGSTFGSGTDVIATAADVGLGAEGAGAWISLRSPAGWIPGSDTVDLLLSVDDASPAQTQRARMTSGQYTGGSAVAVPTASGAETVNITSGDNIIPWAGGATPGQWIGMYTDRGDIDFYVKEIADNGIHYHMALRGNTDLIGGGKGGYRCWLHRTSDAAGTSLILNRIQTGTYHRSFNSPGTVALANSNEAYSTAWVITGWFQGRDFEGEAIDVDIDFYQDAATHMRYYGKWMDLRASVAGQLLPNGELDDTESGQTFRKVHYGNVWIYLPTSALPLD